MGNQQLIFHEISSTSINETLYFQCFQPHGIMTKKINYQKSQKNFDKIFTNSINANKTAFPFSKKQKRHISGCFLPLSPEDLPKKHVLKSSILFLERLFLEL